MIKSTLELEVRTQQTTTVEINALISVEVTPEEPLCGICGQRPGDCPSRDTSSAEEEPFTDNDEESEDASRTPIKNFRLLRPRRVKHDPELIEHRRGRPRSPSDLLAALVS